MDDTILDLAVVGSRTRGFNHEAASKLQRLMMATSEVEELAGPDASPDQRAAIASLHSALADLEALFAEHRALAKGSAPAEANLAAVLARASHRANVALALDLDPSLVGQAREPELVQALGQLLDAVVVGRPTRSVAVAGHAVGARIELSIAAGASSASSEVALALVAHVLARTGGSVAHDASTIRVVI